MSQRIYTNRNNGEFTSSYFLPYIIGVPLTRWMNKYFFHETKVLRLPKKTL